MSYQVLPNSEAWANGVVCLPKSVIKKIKFIDAQKLSVLILALGNGEIDEKSISASLKISVDDVTEALEYWVCEGILTDGAPIKATEQDGAQPVQAKQVFEKLPMPSHTPKDVVAICRENTELASLLREAQTILGSTISASMQSNLINMVTYYGLTVPVVLTLLQYYKGEHEKGKSFTVQRLLNMAKEWADEEINTLDKASQKLQDLININDLWNKIISLCEMEYHKPTKTQEKMLYRWHNDFSLEMITFAINTMKKYNEKENQSLKEVDNILKDWKRKDCKTPDDVKSYVKPENKSGKKSGKSTDKLQSKPSFDINQIANDALMNDDFDV